MNPVDEFLALKKQAGLGTFLSDFGKGLIGAEATASAGRAVGQAFQGPAAAALVTGFGLGVSKGVGAVRERFGKARDFKTMVENNPTLREGDSHQVKMLYDSLRRLSPTMAKDPLLAGSFVRTMIARGTEGGAAVPFDTAKMLSETERNVSQSGKRHNLLEAISGAAGRTFLRSDVPQSNMFDPPRGPGGTHHMGGAREDKPGFSSAWRAPGHTHNPDKK